MIIVAKGSFAQENVKNSAPHFSHKYLHFNLLNNVYTQPKPFVIPGNFYSSQLGFFCKKELKFESVTKIPFRFRLGSLVYTDWLEGKKNAGIMPAY